jgi:NAD(P)-dependent dehydrogenase (short-subunit alcohol dehydrogenase family)
MSEASQLRTFRGAAAIVTGGASGIGRALAERVAVAGAGVVIGDRQVELAEEVAQGIRARRGRADAVEMDVTDFAAVEALVQETLRKYGRLDYMFNNAGIGIAGEVAFYCLEDWNQVLDVNLRGVVHGVQASYPVMLEQGFGHLVNTASMAGLMPTPGTVSYAASKHAVVGLSRSLRIEAAAAGVRVSVLCPGVIRTPILDGGRYGKTVGDISASSLKKMMERTAPMDPTRFARKVLRAVARNRAIIIVPWWWKGMWWLHRWSPSLGQWMAARMYTAFLEAQRGAPEEETPDSPDA